jgi:quinohemoprotein ethanol dehydrogenase
LHGAEMNHLAIGAGRVVGLRACRVVAGFSAAVILLGAIAGCKGGTANPAMFSDATDGTNWPGYGRTFDESHYSPLTEVNDKNVGDLGLAWFRDVPQSISNSGAPLAIDGVLYYAYGLSVVNAVDAITGKTLWEYDPEVAKVAGPKLKPAWGIRGIAYWNGKIYVGTQDGRLIALDAKGGKPVWSVQTTDPNGRQYITGAPRVFGGKVIIGNGGADFGPVRGYVTTYDAETGKQLWRFHTVPGDPAKGFENKAMEMAARTWKGEAWKQGGGGTVWNAITYDPELNRIYIGVGNGSPWNQKIRSPGGGDNLFLCSIVALDADTGEYVWHYQTNPGETWDFNSAMDIQLATLQIGGKNRRVLMHAPKNGFFYVIDRDTGKLVSAEPIVKVTWAKGIDLKSGRPIENPESRFPNGEALIWPGPAGAHNWQAMAFSPITRLVYIPTSALPGYYNDKGLDPTSWKPKPGIILNNGLNSFDLDIPAPKGENQGSLQAWDPVRQKRVWSVPMRGPVNGGVMATGGNLVFQGQANGLFVARAADTGKELWSFDAQNGMVSHPITFRAGGKQYVTVLTGFSGAAALMGGVSSQFGWNYRTQNRRVLTFVLNGKAALPPAQRPGPEQPLLELSFKADPAKVAVGADVYALNCQLCHGPGTVAGGNAPDLRASGIPLSDDAFRQVVHEGALEPQGMPRFRELDNAELEALRHYIRSKAVKK